MYISNMKKKKKDGVVYVGGNVPDGATIIETMDILNAEDGYDLVRIADDENVGANIWLKDGDVKENYKEAKREDIE